MIVNERDVRVALAGIIAAAVPLAIVHNRWVLAFDPGQWARTLRSPADSKWVKFMDGYMAGDRAREDRERMRSGDLVL